MLEKWFIRNRKADYKAISKKFNISEMVSKLLVNRDIIQEGNIKSFVNPCYENFHNAREMKDLEKGVRIIRQKIEQGMRIMIVGDYDVSSLN